MIPQIEKIARDLCIADGFDPDERVFPYNDFAIGVRGLAIVPQIEPAPQWTYYMNYVQATLDAVLGGHREGDLRDEIEAILAGKIVQIEEADIVPGPAPDWRYKMGLKAT
jgi:hypothetical protein